MKKEVWLTISSTQQFEDMEQEHIDLATAAELEKKDGKYYISYEESELTGLEGTHTMIALDGKSVTMIRTGTCPSEMLFAENQRHVGLYQTPVGESLTIATHTSLVRSTVGDDGGDLTIEYTIEVDNAVMGAHHFEMHISGEPEA